MGKEGENVSKGHDGGEPVAFRATNERFGDVLESKPGRSRLVLG